MEPKSSPLHPRSGHLKLSKVAGSSVWWGGDQGGELPSPKGLAALDRSPLGLVLCINFKRRSQGLWDAKCCLGCPGRPCKLGGCNSCGGFPLPPLQCPGPCLRDNIPAWEVQTCWFHPALRPEQGHHNLAARQPKQDSQQGKGRTKGVLGTNPCSLTHPGQGWTRFIVGHRGCSASSHHCPQLPHEHGSPGAGQP